MEKNNKVYIDISNILAKAGVKHDYIDIQSIIDLSNQFYDSGYEYSYNEVTSFISNKENISIIKQNGLRSVLESMKNMKLGTIVRKKKQNRNEKCSCGSNLKSKRCCTKN